MDDREAESEHLEIKDSFFTELRRNDYLLDWRLSSATDER